MLAWKIFVHSLRMVSSDFSTTLRVSSPVIATSLLGVVLAATYGPEFTTGETDAYGSLVVFFVLNYISGLWVAVSWHRYCLLEEFPDSALPAFNGPRILAYFGWGLLLALILAASFGVLGGIAALVGGFGSPGFSPIGGMVFGIGAIFMLWVVQRIALVLPASAIGNPITFGDSWRATQSVGLALFVTLFLIVFFGFLTGYIAGFVGSFSFLLGQLLQLVSNWLITMVSLSILTTFYGYCIEKRELT